MKGFMSLIFLLIVAAGAGYYFEPKFKKMVDEQVFYKYGAKSHVSYGYKWQDKDGAWQLTQQPPTDGTPFEKIKVRDDWNVMDAPKSSK